MLSPSNRSFCRTQPWTAARTPQGPPCKDRCVLVPVRTNEDTATPSPRTSLCPQVTGHGGPSEPLPPKQGSLRGDYSHRVLTLSHREGTARPWRPSLEGGVSTTSGGREVTLHHSQTRSEGHDHVSSRPGKCCHAHRLRVATVSPAFGAYPKGVLLQEAFPNHLWQCP